MYFIISEQYFRNMFAVIKVAYKGGIVEFYSCNKGSNTEKILLNPQTFATILLQGYTSINEAIQHKYITNEMKEPIFTNRFRIVDEKELKNMYKRAKKSSCFCPFVQNITTYL